jgi:hypothetical protein
VTAQVHLAHPAFAAVGQIQRRAFVARRVCQPSNSGVTLKPSFDSRVRRRVSEPSSNSQSRVNESGRGVSWL